MKFSRLSKALCCSVRNATTVSCRALGLQVFVFAFQRLRHLAVGKGYDEPTKVAIRKSRTTAMMRALIHVVPISVAMWEIIINWNTYYFGATIRNQAYYQFGAKVHEMTAQASLAAVVFSYIRYEMSLGQGLPFGALFSGLQISHASYLWSMEFWGSICADHLPIRRKLGMGLVVTVAIVLAATVGPSSAILLIPRLDYWPAGATNVWLNTTSHELWPDRWVLSAQAAEIEKLNCRRTNSSQFPASCLLANPLLMENDCPSSGWQAIEDYLSLTNNLLPLEFQNDYAITLSPTAVQVTGASSLRQLRITREVTDFGPGYNTVTVLATTQQAAVADALSTTGMLWTLALDNVTTRGHGSVQGQLDAVHSISTDYYQPYTLTSCEHDTIFGHEDSNPVAFPPPPGSSPQMLNTNEFNDSILSTHAFTYPGITRSQILDTPGSPGDYRLRWLELPQNPFNGTAIGAVVLLPRTLDNATQDMLVCNLGAGWGTSKINMSTFAAEAQTVLSEVGLGFRDLTPGYSAGPSSEEYAIGDRGWFSLPQFPQRPIIVTEDWAQYLNPYLSDSNTTVFHHLMTSQLLRPGPAISARIILAGLLANGLAKIGSTSRLQGTMKTAVQVDGSVGLDGNPWFSGKGDAFIVDPVESTDWVKLRVHSIYEGYAYNTTGATPKVAICFLLAYCVFALAHILYPGITGISSTCWDSIGEVTALAINSAPSVLLRNTCAGITELNIYKIPVRVLALPDNENIDGEHLELVFGNLEEKSIQHRVIRENRVYGTMPLLVAEKNKKL